MQIFYNRHWRWGSVALLVLTRVLVITGGLVSAPKLRAQDLPFAQSMSVSGDSTTRAFNANDQVACPFSDQVQFSWATGGEGFLSHRQLLAERLGEDLVDGSTVFNHARSGSTMRDDFFNQASAIRRALVAAPAPRYVPVFFGHNDACSDRSQREGSDLDGQSVVAATLWDGLQCSSENPCCMTTGDALTDATCERIDTQSTYAGGFWQGSGATNRSDPDLHIP